MFRCFYKHGDKLSDRYIAQEGAVAVLWVFVLLILPGTIGEYFRSRGGTLLILFCLLSLASIIYIFVQFVRIQQIDKRREREEQRHMKERWNNLSKASQEDLIKRGLAPKEMQIKR